MFRHRQICGDRRQARGDFGLGGGRLGGHYRGGGRGGRLGRFFDHGDLRYVLLHLIAEKPRHGYELIKAIEERQSPLGRCHPRPYRRGQPRLRRRSGARDPPRRA